MNTKEILESYGIDREAKRRKEAEKKLTQREIDKYKARRGMQAGARNAQSIYLEGKLGNKSFDYEKEFKELVKLSFSGEFIYEAVRKWSSFVPINFFKNNNAFESLLKKDNSGKYIAYAGWESPFMGWPERLFDHKKAFFRLLEVDKDGQYIISAGQNWPKFDYNRAIARLKELDKEKDKKGELIVRAVKLWQEDRNVNFEKLSRELMEVGSGRYILDAVDNWKSFDYEKASDYIIDNYPHLINMYAKNLPTFNYDKAFDKLVKTARENKKWKDGAQSIFSAGIHFKKFDREKALKILEEFAAKDEDAKNILERAKEREGWGEGKAEKEDVFLNLKKEIILL